MTPLTLLKIHLLTLLLILKIPKIYKIYLLEITLNHISTTIAINKITPKINLNKN